MQLMFLRFEGLGNEFFDIYGNDSLTETVLNTNDQELK
jgi:hypothetical protein